MRQKERKQARREPGAGESQYKERTYPGIPRDIFMTKMIKTKARDWILFVIQGLSVYWWWSCSEACTSSVIISWLKRRRQTRDVHSLFSRITHDHYPFLSFSCCCQDWGFVCMRDKRNPVWSSLSSTFTLFPESQYLLQRVILMKSLGRWWFF